MIIIINFRPQGVKCLRAPVALHLGDFYLRGCQGNARTGNSRPQCVSDAFSPKLTFRHSHRQSVEAGDDLWRRKGQWRGCVITSYPPERHRGKRQHCCFLVPKGPVRNPPQLPVDSIAPREHLPPTCQGKHMVCPCSLTHARSALIQCISAPEHVLGLQPHAHFLRTGERGVGGFDHGGLVIVTP